MASVFTQQPEFLLDEEGNYITITVPAPLSRPNSAVVVLEKNVLTFDCPPYLLKLKLPSKVLDDQSNVSYDDDRSSYTIKVKKDLSAGKASKAAAGKNLSACPATLFAATGKVQSAASSAKASNATKAASGATKAASAASAPKAASTTGASKVASAIAAPKATSATAAPKAASPAGVPKAPVASSAPKAASAVAAPKAANATNAAKASGDKKDSNDSFPFVPMHHVVGGKGKDLPKPKPKKNKSSTTVKNTEVQFYGFGNLYSKMFGQYYSEFYEVIDVTDPDNTTSKQRTDLRVKEERDKFNIDHYLADLMEPDLDLIDNYFKYKPPWVTAPVTDELRNDELESLEEIHKKDWLKNGLSDDVRKVCELQLVDVLFGYAYNNRVMEGDRSVASAWNITKISSVLSWFETFGSVKDVLVTCYRRMITYPLCRSWKLADVVKQDVVNILKLGPKQVTRCLLETRDIFNETDNYYVLNTLYLNDMCHFAYNASAEMTKKLSEEVQKVRVEKHEVNEDLPILECAAHIVATERNPKSAENKKKIERLTKQFHHLKAEKSADRERSSSESSEGSDSSYEPVRTREAEEEYPESESGESCSINEDESEEDVLDDDDEDDADECEKGIADLEIADDDTDEE